MAIAQARITGTTATTVYTSTGSNAITTIAVCNTGAPNSTDETINACLLDLYIVASGDQPDTSGKAGAPGSYTGNQIISQLTVPAGETVFLSEERIVLSNGDFISVVAGTGNLLSITVSTLPV